MAGSLDIHFKLLMASAAQDCVSWLVGDAIVDGAIVDDAIVENALPTNLPRQIDADAIYGFHIGSSQYAIHVEFQALRDPNMAKRLWEYNVIASCKFDRPIYSVVIFLKKDSISTASPYIVYNHNGAEIHHFEFTVVKLWEVPTEMLFEKRFNGLLPLAPLTRDGQQREVVEKVLAELQKGNTNRDIFLLFYGLSSMAFEKTADREWLVRRFDLLDEILNETWAFKELRRRGEEAGHEKGLAEGREEGREEGLAEGIEKARQQELSILSSFVQARFPSLMSLAEECKHVITSTETLQKLVLAVGLAQSEAEARQHLLTALKA